MSSRGQNKVLQCSRTRNGPTKDSFVQFMNRKSQYFLIFHTLNRVDHSKSAGTLHYGVIMMLDVLAFVKSIDFCRFQKVQLCGPSCFLLIIPMFSYINSSYDFKHIREWSKLPQISTSASSMYTTNSFHSSSFTSYKTCMDTKVARSFQHSLSPTFHNAQQMKMMQEESQSTPEEWDYRLCSVVMLAAFISPLSTPRGIFAWLLPNTAARMTVLLRVVWTGGELCGVSE